MGAKLCLELILVAMNGTLATCGMYVVLLYIQYVCVCTPAEEKLRVGKIW
jgi:hypothetical protein